MGEENFNIENENTENQNLEENRNQEEDLEKENKEEKESGSAVKILRQKLEQEIKEKKKIAEEFAKTKEILSISDIGSIISKVERLELENIIAKKYPDLLEEVEDIVKFKKSDETIEDTILRYIGKKTIEKSSSQTGFSLGSSKLKSAPSESSSEPIDREKAEEIFNKTYYQVE